MTLEIDQTDLSDELFMIIEKIEACSEARVLEFLKRLDCHVKAHEEIFSAKSAQTQNFKVALILFSSNFIRYSFNQTEDDDVIFFLFFKKIFH